MEVDTPEETVSESTLGGPDSIATAETPPECSTSDESPGTPSNSFVFKKPLLVGPRKGRIKIAKYKHPDSSGQCDKSDDAGSKEDTTKSQDNSLKNDEKGTKSGSDVGEKGLIYNEPKWAGLPTSEYFFEVLKSGTIVEKIDLSTRSFHVFGRARDCDIKMDHPAVSRYHCILQFRVTGDDNNPPGYYLYDLGSTNGTFLNTEKHKLKPNVYVRVKVGYLLKLGWSTRKYLLQGPASDEEPESELTITEMKQLYEKQKLEAELAEKHRIEMEQLEEEEKRRKAEEDGIDWGMGEDADEETDLSENPFAATQNEELYINDPKKTLRGWFEREGYELEYNCEEKGFGQFVCRVELPIDNARGLPIVAEAVVRGKKKESVVQCALEACRILDQHGLLRQSNHESRKRKEKNWEDNDYYDSDEDTFLDRTGTIEKKRQTRMELAGVKGNSEVHTYQSLIRRHEEILKEIKKIEEELMEFTKKVEQNDEKMQEDEDELDAYMSSLSSNEKRDKKNINKLKNELASLRIEESKVRNLANVAKPAEMPKLKPLLDQSTNKPNTFSRMPMIGKRKVPAPRKQFQVLKEKKCEESHDSGEELDSD